MKNPIIFIVGPTASGKTAAAIELAKKIDGEIICADSRTIYKYMNIGTAKPDENEQSGVKHWCLDLLNPNKKINVQQFQSIAKNIICDIRKRNRIPIIVGGTGLYINSILYNYNFNANYDQNYRKILEEKTVEELQKICSVNNYTLPKNFKNKRHLISTIERRGKKNNDNIMINDAIVVGISTDKKILEQRIKNRIIKMFNSGIVAETQNIISKFGNSHESFKANIYPIVEKYINHDINFDEFLNLAVIKDRQLVKKQLTWFKRDKNIVWLPKEDIIEYITKTLELC